MSLASEVEEGPVASNQADKKADSRRLLSITNSVIFSQLKKRVKKQKITHTESREMPDRVFGRTADVTIPKTMLATAVSHPVLPTSVLAIENRSEENQITNGHHRNASHGNNTAISVMPDNIDQNKESEEGAIGWNISVSPDSSKKTNSSEVKMRKLKAGESDKEERPSSKKRRTTLLRTSFHLRNADFHELFTHIPLTDPLMIAFPCAWKKDVFIHGRLYLSLNYLSFYACFAKWEESFSIAYKDIISVTKEAHAKFMSKTIRIRTNGQDYVCACYSSRDRIFVSIFRLWQNVLVEQPLNDQELQAFMNNSPDNHDASSGDSEESYPLENSDVVPQKPKNTWKSLPENSNHLTKSSPKRGKVHSRKNPQKRETNTAHYQSKCTCTTHLARQYANQILNYDVDQLFELICGDNAFTRDFHRSQKLTEYNYGEWHLNSETGKREREVTYKTINSSYLGMHTLTCQDKQVLEADEPHSMYILNTAVYNEGMKFTDAFYVATRFCMVQCDAEHSSLRLTAEIRYIKNIPGWIKNFIEKQVYASIEQGVNEQIRRLVNYSAKKTSNQQYMPSSSARSEELREDSLSQNSTEDRSSADSSTTPTFRISVKTKTFTGKGTLYDMGLIVIILFLFIHTFLWYKLHSIEQVLLEPEIMCLDQCRTMCNNNMNINTDF